MSGILVGELILWLNRIHERSALPIIEIASANLVLSEVQIRINRKIILVQIAGSRSRKLSYWNDVGSSSRIMDRCGARLIFTDSTICRLYGRRRELL